MGGSTLLTEKIGFRWLTIRFESRVAAEGASALMGTSSLVSLQPEYAAGLDQQGRRAAN